MAKKKDTLKIKFKEGHKELFMAVTYYINKIVDDELIERYIRNKNADDEYKKRLRKEMDTYTDAFRLYSGCIDLKDDYVIEPETKKKRYTYDDLPGNPFKDYKTTDTDLLKRLDTPRARRLIKPMMDHKELHIYFPKKADESDTNDKGNEFIKIVLKMIDRFSTVALTRSEYSKNYFKYRDTKAFKNMLPKHLRYMRTYDLLFNMKQLVKFNEHIVGLSEGDRKSFMIGYAHTQLFSIFKELFEPNGKKDKILKILTGFIFSETALRTPKDEKTYHKSKSYRISNKSWYKYLDDHVRSHLLRHRFYISSDRKYTFTDFDMRPPFS